MNAVQVYVSSFATGASGTSTFYVGNSEQIILNVPKISTTWGSGVVAFTLQGSASSSVSASTMYYWDYGNTTPKNCVVTVSTGGLYEMPNGGGAPFVRIQWDVATTQTTGLSFMSPRTTF